MTIEDLARVAAHLQCQLFRDVPLMPACRIEWTTAVREAVYIPRPRSVIAFNVKYACERMSRWTASILAHELCHAADAHVHGVPADIDSDAEWHRWSWTQRMLAIGLAPEPLLGGGRTHHILDDGPFNRACAEMLRAR